ncbi:MAG: hypothetical protein OCD00_09675 [Colwellia sp.]
MNKYLLIFLIFLCLAVLADDIAITVSTDSSFGVTDQVGADYHIRTNANTQSKQWKSGDTVTMTQGTTTAVWAYNGGTSGTFSMISSSSTVASGGSSGGSGGYIGSIGGIGGTTDTPYDPNAGCLSINNDCA